MREVADGDLSRSVSATSLIQRHQWVQGPLPLAEVQDWAAKRTNEPPGGVRGNAPAPPANACDARTGLLDGAACSHSIFSRDDKGPGAMAVPTRKTSPSRRGMRRSHQALPNETFNECGNCGEL